MFNGKRFLSHLKCHEFNLDISKKEKKLKNKNLTFGLPKLEYSKQKLHNYLSWKKKKENLKQYLKNKNLIK